MKKFVTTTLFGLAVAACAFAFTACDGNGGNETSYTVTAEEWTSALKYVTEGKNNLNVVFTNSFDNESTELKYAFDVKNNIGVGTYDEDDGPVTSYIWKDSDGKYYDASGRWYSDSEGNKEYRTEKIEISKETFENDGIAEANLYYFGGRYYNAILDKFSDFTYNEATKSYTAKLELKPDEDSEQTNHDLTIKFENGKIVYFKAAYLYHDSYEDKDYTISDEFKFSAAKTLTVPDDIKNLPVNG